MENYKVGQVVGLMVDGRLEVIGMIRDVTVDDGFTYVFVERLDRPGMPSIGDEFIYDEDGDGIEFEEGSGIFCEKLIVITE